MKLLNKFITNILAPVGIQRSTDQRYRIASPKSKLRLSKGRIPSHRGYREDLGVIHDSKMEANIHRFYRHQSRRNGIIKVEYEPKAFKFETNKYGIRYYTPDFRLSDKNSVWYVEVKGWMDQQAHNKARLMAKYYSGVKIYYIFPKQYKLIEEEYGHSIKNWEW